MAARCCLPAVALVFVNGRSLRFDLQLFVCRRNVTAGARIALVCTTLVQSITGGKSQSAVDVWFEASESCVQQAKMPSFALARLSSGADTSFYRFQRVDR